MAREGHSPGHKAIPAESNHPCASESWTQVDHLSQVTLKGFLKHNTISQQIMTHLHPHEPVHGVAALARAAM